MALNPKELNELLDELEGQNGQLQALIDKLGAGTSDDASDEESDKVSTLNEKISRLLKKTAELDQRQKKLQAQLSILLKKIYDNKHIIPENISKICLELIEELGSNLSSLDENVKEDKDAFLKISEEKELDKQIEEIDELMNHQYLRVVMLDFYEKMSKPFLSFIIPKVDAIITNQAFSKDEAASIEKQLLGFKNELHQDDNDSEVLTQISQSFNQAISEDLLENDLALKEDGNQLNITSSSSNKHLLARANELMSIASKVNPSLSTQQAVDIFCAELGSTVEPKNVLDTIVCTPLFIEMMRKRKIFPEPETKQNQELSSIQSSKVDLNALTQEQIAQKNKYYNILNQLQDIMNEVYKCLLQRIIHRIPVSTFEKIEMDLFRDWLFGYTQDWAKTANGKLVVGALIERSIQSPLIWSKVIEHKKEAGGVAALRTALTSKFP